MSIRKIDEITYKDGRKIKTYYNPDLREYVVKFYNSQGVHMDASDYFTNDKEDAMATARVDLDGDMTQHEQSYYGRPGGEG